MQIGPASAAEPSRPDPYGRVAPTPAILSRETDPRRQPDRKVRIVALQAGTRHSRDGNPGLEANFDALATQAREAARTSPDLIVFPEYAMTGWPYPKIGVMNGCAEAVPGDGRWYQQYVALAKEMKMALVGWLVESDQGRLYNCAFILDREGHFVGKYRKVLANLGEQTWWGWSQGESCAPIEYDGVKYGLNICADMESPEPTRCSELLGADVILHMSISDDMQHLVPTRASDSGLSIVMSIFRGGSYAVDALGNSLGKLPAESPGWKAFELTPFQPQIGRKYGGLWDIREGNRNLRNPKAFRILADETTRPAWTSVFFDNEGRSQTARQLTQRFGGRYDANDPAANRDPLVRFAAPWTSPFHVDAAHPYQLVNDDGTHLFLLNKTAWGYFNCKDPQGVLDRAKAVGANVIRVTLEGWLYPKVLNMDLWPWAGTRQEPDFSRLDTAYWDRIEERVRLAGENGIGLDVVFYFTLQPEIDKVAQQQPYWQEAIRRLSKYSNVLTWEVANEYTANEAFQDTAGRYFKEHDPHHRPVCTADGTTDDAVWPDKDWMGLAINHTCTSSLPKHDLRNWYLALARNTRSHGKPAFVNETGREKRHLNDDGIHRRKQSWLGNAAGCFWTFHSFGGCEGIDDPDYRAPGEEFVRPMVDVLKSQPIWQMNPTETTCVADAPSVVQSAMSTPDRAHTLAYLCTRNSGDSVSGCNIRVALPDGKYTLTLRRPADGSVLETRPIVSQGASKTPPQMLPDFKDDLAVIIDRVETRERTLIPGTQ